MCIRDRILFARRVEREAIAGRVAASAGITGDAGESRRRWGGIEDEDDGRVVRSGRVDDVAVAVDVGSNEQSGETERAVDDAGERG